MTAFNCGTPVFRLPGEGAAAGAGGPAGLRYLVTPGKGTEQLD